MPHYKDQKYYENLEEENAELKQLIRDMMDPEADPADITDRVEALLGDLTTEGDQ